jgi:hypothetical protein
MAVTTAISATVASDRVGMALNEAPGAGQPVSVLFYDNALNPGVAVTEGVLYILSASGAIAPSTDALSNDNIVFIMGATTSSTVVFRPVVTGGTLA